MIFDILGHIAQIINETKIQTRRLGKSYYRTDKEDGYAIQPGRTQKGIPHYRIKMDWIRDEYRFITEVDAKKEGGYTPHDYEILWGKMYPKWRFFDGRTVFEFHVIEVPDERR